MLKFPLKYAIPNAAIIDADGSKHVPFAIPVKEKKVVTIECVASLHKRKNGPDLEHLAIYGKKKAPEHATVVALKLLFWDETDIVSQYYRSKEEMNKEGNVIHLWRDAR